MGDIYIYNDSRGGGYSISDPNVEQLRYEVASLKEDTEELVRSLDSLYEMLFTDVRVDGDNIVTSFEVEEVENNHDLISFIREFYPTVYTIVQRDFTAFVESRINHD